MNYIDALSWTEDVNLALKIVTQFSLADSIADVIRVMPADISGDMDSYIHAVVAHVCTVDHVVAAHYLIEFPPPAWTALQVAVLEGALRFGRKIFCEEDAERFAVAIAATVTPDVEARAERFARASRRTQVLYGLRNYRPRR
jgi:hypothetical protein